MKDVVILHYPEVRHSNWALLEDAAQNRAIRLTTWEPHRVQVYCADDRVQGCYDGKQVQPEMVLHRTVAAFQGIVLPALRSWRAGGAVVLNEPGAAYRSRDKLLTSVTLCSAKVPIVQTVAFVELSRNAINSLENHSDLIIKPAHGVRGEGIRTFRTADEFVRGWDDEPVPTAPYLGVREHYLVQPLIDGGGRDLRAFVVGEVCVALMERRAATGEVRANLALGATPRALTLDHAAASVAVSALQACQLDYGGVDLIEDDTGTIRVLEVDAWAGFAGITAVTGEDVAGAILQHALVRRLEESGAT